MATLILDTNQILERLGKLEALPEGFEDTGLSPYVFAEIKRVAPLRSLARFPLRLGMSTGHVMDDLAVLETEEDVEQYEPFLPHEECKELRHRLSGMAEIPPNLRTESTRLKCRAKKFKLNMLKQSEMARQELAKLNGGNMPEPVTNPVAELREHWTPETWVIERGATDGGKRRTALEPKRLTLAAMNNPRLSRFFCMQVLYMLCVTRVFDTSLGLNIEAPPKGKKLLDEWPDMSNVLFAADGDVVCTADGWLQRAGAVVEEVLEREARVRYLPMANLL